MARIQCWQRARMFGQPVEELRQDGTGVAARAVDGVVAHPAEQFTGMAAGPAERAIEHAAQGGSQVVAGVSVGHRKHIDAIEPVTGGNDPSSARCQGAAQGRGGDGGVLGGQFHGSAVCLKRQHTPAAAQQRGT